MHLLIGITIQIFYLKFEFRKGSNVTPDDGLDLVKKLAGMLTILRAQNSKTLRELETTEKNILAAIKEKVAHAGDVIRLKHGFIQKN